MPCSMASCMVAVEVRKGPSRQSQGSKPRPLRYQACRRKLRALEEANQAIHQCWLRVRWARSFSTSDHTDTSPNR